jgi:purine-nucleoside phosphorylase
MSDLYTMIQESADALRARGLAAPELAIILGSGLDGLGEALEELVRVPYEEIPHFAPTTVDFHNGELLHGKLCGRTVAILGGRLHYYEGHEMRELVHPLRSLAFWGARSLVLTSAVGAMNSGYELGDIVAVSDHINLMGDNPLIGPNDERIGPRFPDMSAPYDPEYRSIVAEVAAAEGIALREGVLAAVAGPNLETAAEYRFLSRIGADIVGMSVVPENLAAVHMGLRVLGLSVVTDLCDPDELAPVDIPEILRVAAEADPRLQTLITGFLSTLDNRGEGVQA